jgi:hypothetical protein
MKKSVLIKWANLNSEQRNQVKAYFSEEIKRKEVFEHTLNTGYYHVNTKTGNIIL